MEPEAILALYDLDQRIKIEYPDTRKEGRRHLIRHLSEATVS